MCEPRDHTLRGVTHSQLHPSKLYGPAPYQSWRRLWLTPLLRERARVHYVLERHPPLYRRTVSWEGTRGRWNGGLHRLGSYHNLPISSYPVWLWWWLQSYYMTLESLSFNKFVLCNWKIWKSFYCWSSSINSTNSISSNITVYNFNAWQNVK